MEKVKSNAVLQSSVLDALVKALEEIDALDKQRKSGPWMALPPTAWEPNGMWIIPAVAHCGNGELSAANATFIVALENAWPMIREALSLAGKMVDYPLAQEGSLTDTPRLDTVTVSETVPASMSAQLRFWGGSGETESQACMIKAASVIDAMVAGLHEVRGLLMEDKQDPLFAIEDALVPLDIAVAKAGG